MEACILPYDHVAINKSQSNKNEKCNVSDAVIVPIVGGRDQETKLELRFYDFKEFNTLRNKDNDVLREW